MRAVSNKTRIETREKLMDYENEDSMRAVSNKTRIETDAANASPSCLR